MVMQLLEIREVETPCQVEKVAKERVADRGAVQAAVAGERGPGGQDPARGRGQRISASVQSAGSRLPMSAAFPASR